MPGQVHPKTSTRKENIMSNVIYPVNAAEVLGSSSADSEEALRTPGVPYEDSNGLRIIGIYDQKLMQREVCVYGEIDNRLANNFTAELKYLCGQSSDPITLYVNSPGGSVDAGLVMYDTLKAAERKGVSVEIYVTGMAASMAAVVAAGGPKGHRHILPHSRFMIHEPLISGGFGGSATQVKTTAESILETKATINGLLAADTGKTIEEINEATDHDNFMTAEEAVAFGLCDDIRDIL